MGGSRIWFDDMGQYGFVEVFYWNMMMDSQYGEFIIIKFLS